MRLLWGDIHNHCGISYGYGSLENALTAAREQLDFCSVTGHAMWPDMPVERKELAFQIGYHKRGFEKLSRNWDSVRKTIADANVPREFITFQSYEMHSRRYGDYFVFSPDDGLPLIEASSPSELVSRLSPAEVIAVPHHTAYTPGYRGIIWESFSPDISPLVEVYSKHGCGISDSSPFQYLSPMGPRDSRGTAFAGLRSGNRFGFTASTDHHAGYPGSHGDGRVAVWAEEKTRESIWVSLLKRRTYAVTGDLISCRFDVNGSEMGSETEAEGRRCIRTEITACDSLSEIVIFKNTRPWKSVFAPTHSAAKAASTTAGRCKVRIETGWGSSDEAYLWQGNAAVRNGSLISVERAFRGRSVLAPSKNREEDPEANSLENRVVEEDGKHVVWRCTTFRNPTPLHPMTSALILEIEGDGSTVLEGGINGHRLEISVGELINGSRSFHMQDYSSEAVLIHRAVPESRYSFLGEWEDAEREDPCDIYHLEVRQANGQMAWVSPVFVIS